MMSFTSCLVKYLYLKPCFRRTFRFIHSNQVEREFNRANVFHPQTLYPWKSKAEFSKSMASAVIYNKDGLIAVNKPYGIKIKKHSESDQQNVLNPNIPVCEYTLEDAVPSLMEHFDVPFLKISKSCERYSSGIVLFCTSEKVLDCVTKSIRIARHRKINHLTHWIITLGSPVLNFKTEEVGLTFQKVEENKMKLPIIVSDSSKRSRKKRLILGVRVEYTVISENRSLETSLVEISSSSDASHFARVYASSHIATILGDPLYSCRMNKLLGIPIKIHLQNSLSFNMQPIPERMALKLNLPKGVQGHAKIPNMLHFRSIVLPLFKGEDVLITAEPSFQFKWTAEQLTLLPVS